MVVEGDTLTKISRKYYGSSSRWEDILKANRDIVKDEKSLVVGSTPQDSLSGGLRPP